jgi:hypothetical protein
VSTRHREAFADIAGFCPVVFAKDVGMQHEDDAVLIEHCGAKRLAFVTEDKRIRMKDYYIAVIKDAGIGFVEVKFKKATFEYKNGVYKRFMDSFPEFVKHPRPFCVVLHHEGFRFAALDACVTRRDGHEEGVGERVYPT